MGKALPRAIAEKVGDSQTQVVLDLQSEGDAGEQDCSPASPAFTKGRDGKTYASPEAKAERREQIAELHDQGMSQREIAAEVGIGLSPKRLRGGAFSCNRYYI